MDHFRIKSPAEQIVEARFGKPAETLLREWYARRWTQEEIAQELGITRMTVHRWTRRYGLDRRVPRPAA